MEFVKGMCMTNQYHTECAISIDSVVTEIFDDFDYSERQACPSSLINVNPLTTHR